MAWRLIHHINIGECVWVFLSLVPCVLRDPLLGTWSGPAPHDWTRSRLLRRSITDVRKLADSLLIRAFVFRVDLDGKKRHCRHPSRCYLGIKAAHPGANDQEDLSV